MPPAKPAPLKDHVIVCAYGVVGQKVVETLVGNGIPFVVVDVDPITVKKLQEMGYNAIEGDATRSRVLREASIGAAKAIAIVMDSDAKNLFSVLAARDLNKGIYIATRANDEFLREKLLEAGADYIVMPHKSASKEIVKELFKK